MPAYQRACSATRLKPLVQAESACFVPLAMPKAMARVARLTGLVQPDESRYGAHGTQVTLIIGLAWTAQSVVA